MTARLIVCLVWCGATAAAVSRPVDPSGAELFAKVWTVDEGAGPLANAQSCTACHTVSAEEEGTAVDPEAFVLVSPMETDPSGGQLFRRFLFRPARAVVRRALPPKVAARRPPALHGVGLLASVSDETIAALEDSDDRNVDGISGRARRSNGVIGRFGWKARSADLDTAVAAALAAEMGLTSPRHPGDSPEGRSGAAVPEVNAAQLAALVDFVRRLPAPPPSCVAAEDRPGRRLFVEVGCANCHLPALRAGGGEAGVPSTVIHSYSDLLLHDVGPELSDGFAEAGAAGAEFRTTPLWGIGRRRSSFLHDGRAKTLDAAIRAHGGEALASRQRYSSLARAPRAALRSFVGCL